jgi:hypothetical protein
MHKEIFDRNQVELLPLVKQFKREYYLVGGTAVALHIGHRRSVDFDLFKFNPIKPKSIIDKISQSGFPYLVTRRVTEQLNVTVHNVKLTFYQYPFEISSPVHLGDILRLPELIDLAAMKAYALGRRSKWKDYVDLFFILKDHFSIGQISEKAVFIFGQLFSEKLFRAQLCYYEDIDYTEQVEYIGPSVAVSEIRDFLTDKATELGT